MHTGSHGLGANTHKQTPIRDGEGNNRELLSLLFRSDGAIPKHRGPADWTNHVTRLTMASPSSHHPDNHRVPICVTRETRQ